jgi:predicted nucleic acid-binding protein
MPPTTKAIGCTPAPSNSSPYSTKPRSPSSSPYPILLESHSLILKRLGIPAAFRLIEEITQGADLINLTIDDYQQAAQLLKRFPDQPITLFDASTAVLANRLHLPVWTYDHHFDIMKTTVWRD